MRLFLSILALALSTTLLAQQGIFGDNAVVYKRQKEGGLIAYTNGWGGDFAFGKHVDGFRRRMIHLEVASMKHPKQIRSFNPFYEDAKSYFFGKVNSVFNIKATWGYKKVLFDRLRASGVQVSRRWALGPTIAFQKPVYLLIGKPDFPFQFLEEERYDPNIHSIDNIYGRASYFSGIDQMALVPGVHAKYVMHFEWSQNGVNNPNVQSLEFGLSGSAYLKPVEIMATEDNAQFFLNLFLAVKIGRKYVD